MHSRHTLRLGLAAVALLGLAATQPALAGTTPFSLPLTDGQTNPLDVGTFAGGATIQITASGHGSIAGGDAFPTNSDGSLFAPATGPFTFANPGANYPIINGGDGINHFADGGTTYDFNGSGYSFAGPETTDTTNPADIRFGAIVGTFSATPTRADYFLVGDGGTFTAPAGGGTLYLAVNDTVSSDNTGSYSVTVTSPAPVPEASTTASFGLLLALGLGGVIFAAKKKQTA